MNSVVWLAVRFLFPKRENRFLSVATLVAILAVGLGVASLLVSLSVISGFQKVYKESILKFNSHLVLTSGGEIEDIHAVIKVIPEEMKKEIVGWHPFIYREGMMIAGQELRGVVLKGVDFEKINLFSHLEIVRQASLDGKLSGIFLGKKLAEQLGEGIREVRFLFPRSSRKELIHRFQVQGTFESGMYDYDSSFAFIPLEEAQKLFQLGTGVTGIEFWLQDPDRAFYWADFLKGDPEFPFFVMTWREINENLFRALETEKVVFFILMVVLTAVASFNLLSSLIMMILEKRPQIAVLRAVGLPWSRIRKIFLFNGLLIGCAGLFIGFALGSGLLFFLKRSEMILLEPEVYFVSRVPVVLSGINIILVAGVGLGLVGLGCLLTLHGLNRLPILRALVEK
ncbi:MAG: ABC transporter permease [Deltaproteobacteria bacterium]|nr:ABC transporter permease [Deltaproteobacteria bacterium]